MAANQRRLTKLVLAGALVASAVLVATPDALASRAQPSAPQASPRWTDVSPTPFSGVIATGFNTVSCASPSDCIAVGVFETGTSFELFSQHWTGAGWASQIMPRPTSTNISGVSCTAANSCEAVGNQSNGVSQVPMAERWNGIHWTLQNAPAPSGISRGFLLAVSCASKASCVGVGFQTTMSGRQRALAEHWDGKTWQVTPAPNPAGKQFIELTSVSCPSTTFCLATGTYAGGTFAATWNGKHWGVTGPVPDAPGALHSALLGVSCPTTSDCMAVGTSSLPQTVPLTERWDGTKWSVLTTPVPDGATASGLNAISCSSVTACSAVASVTRRSVNSSVAYAWTGHRWTKRAIITPPGALSVGLRAVSCNSARACMAVGDYNDSSNTEQMLAEQYS